MLISNLAAAFCTTHVLIQHLNMITLEAKSNQNVLLKEQLLLVNQPNLVKRAADEICVSVYGLGFNTTTTTLNSGCTHNPPRSTTPSILNSVGYWLSCWSIAHLFSVVWMSFTGSVQLFTTSKHSFRTTTFSYNSYKKETGAQCHSIPLDSPLPVVSCKCQMAWEKGWGTL